MGGAVQQCFVRFGTLLFSVVDVFVWRRLAYSVVCFKCCSALSAWGLYKRSLVGSVNKEIFDSLSSGRTLSSFSDDELVYDSLSLNCVPTPPTKRHKRSRWDIPAQNQTVKYEVCLKHRGTFCEIDFVLFYAYYF